MNIEKFSFAEACNNPKGKTSMALICGGLTILSGAIAFCYSIFTHYGEGIGGSIAVLTIGSALLGIRRFTPDKEISTNAVNTQL